MRRWGGISSILLSLRKPSLNLSEIKERFRVGQHWSGEYLVQRRDKTQFPAFVTDTPVFDEHGNLTARIGVSSDITERKRAEDAMRFLADASASLAQLVDYQSTLQVVAGLAVPKFADWCAVDIVESRRHFAAPGGRSCRSRQGANGRRISAALSARSAARNMGRRRCFAPDRPT